MGNTQVTDKINFFGGHTPKELTAKYGSPLYVYNENILRERCREIKGMCGCKNFRVNYSPKANTNLALLKIIQEEGLDVDAMSPGEIIAGIKAGFDPSQIFYICNNVSDDEMQFAIEKGVKISVDSLSQLNSYGRLNKGGSVAVRFNPGIGAGHHEKVVTAGKNTKFGVNLEDASEVLQILEKHELKLIGINHHIGSLFMTGGEYLGAMRAIFDFVLGLKDKLADLEFIDIGGGFGIPYKKQEGEARLDLAALGQEMDREIALFEAKFGREITIKVEPGRYIPSEAGVLLGNVHAVKYNGDTRYIGTDIGMNVLLRPSMYGSHHDIEVYSQKSEPLSKTQTVTIVGNICETGDILAKERCLPEICEGDTIGVLDAGAYGFSMCSNYNMRLRPAEVLITRTGDAKLIRRRDTFDDLFAAFC